MPRKKPDFRSAAFFREAVSLAERAGWLYPYFQQYKIVILLVVFLGFAAYFCAAGLMFTSGYLISKAATQPYNILLIYLPIVLTRFFGIARPGFRYAERLLSHHFVLRLTADLRLRLYQSLEPMALHYRERIKAGEMLSILADDIERIQDWHLRTVLPVVLGLLLYGAVILALGLFSPVAALLLLLWLGVMLIILPLTSLAVNGARAHKRKILRNSQYQSLTDGVLGVADWLFSGRYQDFIRRHEEREVELDDLSHQSDRFSRRRDFLWQALAVLLVVYLLLWSGNLAVQGNLNANWIAAFVLAVFPLLEAWAPLPERFSTLPAYGDALERLNLKKPVQPDPAEKLEGLPAGPIAISFSDVSFQYVGEQPMFQDLNLFIPPGQKIAVLGPSGAGKSTLLSLIRGDLVPARGEVRLNDVVSASLGDAVTRLVAVLNQRPYLFDTTIGNNVRLGDPHASDTEIEYALLRAGLGDVIDRLPQGVDTPVEEAGARFSGGERQRIALARILLQKTPIVLLDEPTIGLDPQLESRLMAAIFESLKDKTIVWVTHHLTDVENMDKIIFLEKGRIVLAGTHTELWRFSERYRVLYGMDHA